MRILAKYNGTLACFEVVDIMADGGDILAWRTDNSCMYFKYVFDTYSHLIEIFKTGCLDLSNYEVRELGKS